MGGSDSCSFILIVARIGTVGWVSAELSQKSYINSLKHSFSHLSSRENDFLPNMFSYVDPFPPTSQPETSAVIYLFVFVSDLNLFFFLEDNLA